MKMKNKDDSLEGWLNANKKWYWRDPHHARALQRAKYKRYPQKIYEMNRRWQQNNLEHWKMLMKFGNAIFRAKMKNDFEKVNLLKAAREEYKKSHKQAKTRNMQDA